MPNHTPSRQYDIAIIGGGLGGCSAAYHLCELGFRVLLLEGKTYPVDKLCGEVLSPETISSFARMGVWEKIEALDPAPIDSVLITTAAGNHFRGKIPGSAVGLSRYQLDLTLWRHCESAGVETVGGFKVKGVRGELDEGFNLSGTFNDGSSATFTAKFVIGAFGKRSNLDRVLTRRFWKNEHGYVAFKAHYEGIDLGRWVELHSFDGGYCGLCPIESSVPRDNLHDPSSEHRGDAPPFPPRDNLHDPSSEHRGDAPPFPPSDNLRDPSSDHRGDDSPFPSSDDLHNPSSDHRGNYSPFPPRDNLHDPSSDHRGDDSPFPFREGGWGVRSKKINLCLIATESIFRSVGSSRERLFAEVLSTNPVLRERLAGLKPIGQEFLSISQIAFEPKTCWEGDLMMIGDSAGMITPLCGDGMAMAIRSAELCAPLVGDYLHGRISAPQLKEGYRRLWGGEFRSRIRWGRLLQYLLFRPALASGAVGLLSLFPRLGDFLISQTRDTGRIRSKSGLDKAGVIK